MNALFVGLTRKIELPKGGFLIIDDEVRDIPRSRVFDPLHCSLNPLKGITYRRAREIAEIVFTIYPQGENTLTVRDAKRSLLAELLTGWKPKWFDKLESEETRDILMSPVLKKVLCNPTNFSFKETSVIQARINRAELGDFDALVLGLMLMSFYKGQFVIPDLGFYGRDIHISLIRERRLIAGVNHLNELPVKLRHSVLLIDDKIASGTTMQDAELLASFARLQPHTNAYNDYVAAAIS